MKRPLALMLAIIAGYCGQRFELPEPPPAITVQAPTPASLMKEIQAEQVHAALVQATVVAAQLYEEHGCDGWLAERTAEQALANGLPVRVMAADVIVESSCRPGVVSKRGAVGLMQIEPHVWHVSKEALLNPDTNLQVGGRVLASYVHEYGMRGGLRHYLGTGPSDGATDGYSYADHVLAVSYGK